MAASMDAAKVTAMVLLRPADIKGAEGSRLLLLLPPDPSTSCTAAVTSCMAAACAAAGETVGGAWVAAGHDGSSCDSERKVAMLSMLGWSNACTCCEQQPAHGCVRWTLHRVSGRLSEAKAEHNKQTPTDRGGEVASIHTYQGGRQRVAHSCLQRGGQCHSQCAVEADRHEGC